MRESKTFMLHVRMTTALVERLRSLAETEDQSMSDIVRELIETRLEAK